MNMISSNESKRDYLSDKLINSDLYLKSIPWTESPFFEELLAKSHYSEAIKKQIKFFSENGYLVIDPQIDSFDSLANDIISSLAPEQLKNGSRVLDSWRYQINVRNLTAYPTILMWLKILYQREPIPFQTLNFNVGTEQDTHSDILHFSSVPERFMAGVWLAFEDINEENGALHYYPGSHRLPVYNFQSIGLKKSTYRNIGKQYGVYVDFIKNLIKRLHLKKETIAIKKGHCLIWSANLLHGGDPIKDKTRTRHTLVTHYYFEQGRYYSPLYSDVYAGNIAWKDIKDIRTDQRVPHQHNDKIVRLPLKIKTRYWIENLLHKNELGRNIFSIIKRKLMKRN